MNILIIEDDPGVISFIEKGLKENDFTVKCASDGKTGLDLALKEVFDIIILDVMMPEISGYDLCYTIKFKSPYKDIPILFLTARNQDMDPRISKMMGVDYMHKPFKDKELLAKIKSVMGD